MVERTTQRWAWTPRVGAGDRSRSVSRSAARRARPLCEGLEGRTLLTGGLNTDYTLMGGQWDNSRPISFSVAPDGVNWDLGVNNVNAHLDAEFAGTSWQKEIAAALQTWAASANLNFTPSADGNFDFNASGQGQGDPRFGDIRVGGYAFQNDNTIALTYGPPPNGNTAGGDVKLNTGYDFGPTGQWDLETVLIHELGHSLGLGESPQPASIMYSYYNGSRHDLSGYDVEGIQSMYGPRVADSYQAQGLATAAGTAADITGMLGSDLSGQVTGLSLDRIGDAEYFSLTAPSNAGSSLLVNAVANGHSLMSPQLTIIDAATGQALGTDGHADQYGDTASVAISGVQPGHRYLLEVAGATQDVFSVGDYALQMAFSRNPASPSPTPTPTPTPTEPVTIVPTVPVTTLPTAPTTVTTPTPVAVTLPTTTTPVNLATDPYSASTTAATAHELGPIGGQAIIGDAVLPTGQSIRVFAFEPTGAGPVLLASSHASLMVISPTGQVVASGTGLIGFVAPQAGARYLVVVSSPNGQAVASAAFAIQTMATPALTASATPIAATTGTTTTSTPVVQVGKATPAGSKKHPRPRPKVKHGHH